MSRFMVRFFADDFWQTILSIRLSAEMITRASHHVTESSDDLVDWHIVSPVVLTVLEATAEVKLVVAR